MATPKKEAMRLLTRLAEGEYHQSITTRAWALAFEHVNRYPAASRKDHDECNRVGHPCEHAGDVYIAWWKEAKAQVRKERYGNV